MSRKILITIAITLILTAGCTTTGRPIFKVTATPIGDKFQFDFTVEMTNETHKCTK